MEQNNFEKEVQRKLEELKITPSGSVWMNVEKRIAKKKDRRLILILFFLMLILFSGGYWLFHSTNHFQQSHEVSKLEEDSKPTNKDDSHFTKPLIPPKKNETQSNSDRTKKSKKIVEQTIFRSKEKIIASENKPASKRTNNEENEIASVDSEKLSVAKQKTAEPKNKNRNTKDSIQKKINTDSSTLQMKAGVKRDSSVKNHLKNKSKNPWVFGITFSGGESLLAKNLFGINSSAYVNSGGIPGYYSAPSKIKNSAAFMSGVFLEKNISVRKKILFGITYQYFSLTNKVGNRIDSSSTFPQALTSSNYFYSSANYTNTYHTYRNNFLYIEVPVSIKFQLNRSKNVPLFWNAGINISKLISSNALQFQSNPGIYYRDNSFFNKIQFGLHTAFSAEFLINKKIPFAFGPSFYYGATSIANKGLYQKKHFSFIGIRAEILFHKK